LKMSSKAQDESTPSDSMSGSENIKNTTTDQEWLNLYSEVANSDLTVECVHCGYTLYGDEPRAMVVCLKCWNEGIRDESTEPID
jgi:hypothetical protein